MIEFIHEAVRTKFHAMPLVEQKRYNDWAEQLLESNQFILITSVEEWLPGQWEISVNIRHT